MLIKGEKNLFFK